MALDREIFVRSLEREEAHRLVKLTRLALRWHKRYSHPDTYPTSVLEG